jgi:hypothetical protein
LEAIHKQEKLDPILKLVLLKQTLEIATAGSAACRDAFASHMTHLRGAATPLIAWMDPSSTEAERARPKAQRDLRDLPSLEAGVAAARQNWEKQRAKSARYQWVGWLLRPPGGSPGVELKPGQQATGGLYTLWRPQTGAAARLQPIGRLSGGEVNLSTTDSAILVEGRPVYCLAIDKSSPE